jgi:folate-dependent phosphoribosylglycinamide formyltransferase PurN
MRRKRLAVFVSGGGSNFRAIHEAALRGAVHGDVVALVTDKPGEANCLPLQKLGLVSRVF